VKFVGGELWLLVVSATNHQKPQLLLPWEGT